VHHGRSTINREKYMTVYLFDIVLSLHFSSSLITALWDQGSLLVRRGLHGRVAESVPIR
jgi:hypothetical protein